MGDEPKDATIKTDETKPEGLADDQLDDAAGGLLTWDGGGGDTGGGGSGTYPRAKPKH